MSWLQAFLLGLVQGLTEFLPVSSSGHLAVAQAILGFEEPEVFFDVILHAGTLLSIFIFWRKDLLAMLREAFAALSAGRRAFSFAYWRENDARGMILWVVLASIPTGIIGILFKEPLEAAFGSLLAIAAGFFMTATLLILSRLFLSRAKGEPTLGRSLFVGFMQGLAIWPGLSRSGTTITSGLLAGIKPETAARFSFLMSIPAVLGAVLLKLKDGGGEGIGPDSLAVGFVSSAVSGYLALWLVMRFVRRGRLHVFAPWCALMGVLAVILALR